MNKCRCIREPGGRSGLEGFVIGEEYKYQNAFVRSYPGGRESSFYKIYLSESHYETCGPVVFGRYFEVTEIKRDFNPSDMRKL